MCTAVNWNTQADHSASGKHCHVGVWARAAYLPTFQKMPINSILFYFVLLLREITWKLTKQFLNTVRNYAM